MILYSDNEPGCYLYAELRRDMAISPEAFARFMRIMLMVSLSIGLAFYLIGAWPIVGFLGLDVLLIWGAFKLYACSQKRQFDRLIVDKDGLHIEQHCGKRMQQTQLEPAFTNIHTNEDDNSDPLHVCQRGNCMQIGRWLGAAERKACVKLLRKAFNVRQAALVSR